MSLTITERPDVTGFKSAWADMVEAIEPDIDSLPEPWRSVFGGPMKLLIGSKLSLGIIPPRQQWPINEKISYIVSLLKYPDFVNYDLTYIAGELSELFGIISLSLSLNGSFVLEGPMSRQFTSQTQKIIGVDKKGKEYDMAYGGQPYG